MVIESTPITSGPARRIGLITDDPRRDRGLAQDLTGELACDIYDLYGEELPSAPASAFIADLLDLHSDAVERLRRLLARVRHGATLVLLLNADTPRGRMLGVAIGATEVFTAPFDLPRIRTVLGVQASSPTQPVPAHEGTPSAAAVKQAERLRGFYATVFVPDQPITPGVIDNGTQEVDRAIRETDIGDWVRAVRQFDDATHQHCLLVAGLAAAFASNLGLCAAERHRLTRAALLHDVGKIHVPPAILNKPGKLTDAEMAVVRLHPGRGYDMLVGQGFEASTLAVVRSHHEMLDGSGYPDKLRGHEIPDLVRLVTVCDIHAALIECRPYKLPMASVAAFAILEGMAGRLDPAIVGAFRTVAATLDPPSDRTA